MSERDAPNAFGNGLRAHLRRHTTVAVEAARERARAVDEHRRAEPPRAMAPDELARREQELLDREQRFREHVQGFEAHVAAFAGREEQLRQREAAVDEREAAAVERETAALRREAATAEHVEAATARRPVRDVLREHAELSLSRILHVFDDAMTASDPAGTADHGVRLAAVRALLSEAYAKDGNAGATAAVVDELVQMRERRTAT